METGDWRLTDPGEPIIRYVCNIVIQIPPSLPRECILLLVPGLNVTRNGVNEAENVDNNKHKSWG